MHFDTRVVSIDVFVEVGFDDAVVVDAKSLAEGLGINDNRIVETHLYKHIERDNPRIEVHLMPASSS